MLNKLEDQMATLMQQMKEKDDQIQMLQNNVSKLIELCSLNQK